MPEKIENLVIEILRKIQADMSVLTEGQKTTNQRLSAIEHHMAGFHLTTAGQSDELEALKNRIARIERRLDIHDPDSSPSN
jgi:hypothetical protein